MKQSVRWLAVYGICDVIKQCCEIDINQYSWDLTHMYCLSIALTDTYDYLIIAEITLHYIKNILSALS